MRHDARAIDQRTYLIVLLGGEAGLRCGEMIALEWGDIDLAERQLCPAFGLERTGGNAERWPGARRAGGADELTMTQRYMHLSPAALDAAIGLLDRPPGDQRCGESTFALRAVVDNLRPVSECAGVPTVARSRFQPSGGWR
ncbi:MAG TPA: hypothetical protein VMZ90_10990 [Vicinamibacterales bacterium]|nr:hypothetical protein [Vicinamibacterales bacterium]